MALAMVGRASRQLLQKGNRLQGRIHRIAQTRLAPNLRPAILPHTRDKTTSTSPVSVHSLGKIIRRNSLRGRQLSMATSDKRTNTTTFEVERKFAPTSKSMQLLTSNTGMTPFNSLLPQGTVNFEDIYYDTAKNDLSNAGVWLRQRGNLWQAKVRISGNYTNSAFKELTEIDEISSLLSSLVPDVSLDASDGLQGAAMLEAARFVSYRDKFLVDERFTVILDKTNFGHVVGEVELEKYGAVTTEQDGAEEVDGVPVSRIIAEMDQEIDEFMNRYVWAFPPGKPVGKLSAYFSLKK